MAGHSKWANIRHRKSRQDAKRGKILRAEPVSSIFEQDKAHMVGYFKELEEQMTSYTPYTTKSPDRLDACVYAISSLQNSGRAIFRIS